MVVMWCSMETTVHFTEFDDWSKSYKDNHDAVITIRQGPVVHVVEPAVVLGASGGAQVQVGPGHHYEDDHGDEEDGYVDQHVGHVGKWQ